MIPPIGTIRVVNLRVDGPKSEPHEQCMRVDRTNPVLGNPFLLSDPRDHQARRRALVYYARLINGTTWDGDEETTRCMQSVFGQNREEAAAAEAALRERMFWSLGSLVSAILCGQCLALQCWCATQPCHADVIACYVDRKVRNMVSGPPTEIWKKHGGEWMEFENILWEGKNG